MMQRIRLNGMLPIMLFLFGNVASGAIASESKMITDSSGEIKFRDAVFQQDEEEKIQHSIFVQAQEHSLLQAKECQKNKKTQIWVKNDTVWGLIIYFTKKNSSGYTRKEVEIGQFLCIGESDSIESISYAIVSEPVCGGCFFTPLCYEDQEYPLDFTNEVERGFDLIFTIESFLLGWSEDVSLISWGENSNSEQSLDFLPKFYGSVDI